jgi:hypothetical protein
LDWSSEEKERQKWIEWEGTNTNNFGFVVGVAFMAASLLKKRRTYTIIEYTDAFADVDL